MLVWLGSKLKAESHTVVIRKITGDSVAGKAIALIVDIVLIIALFGFGVVMLAGVDQILNSSLASRHFSVQH